MFPWRNSKKWVRFTEKKRAYYLSFDLSFNLAREHNDGNFLTFEIIKGIMLYSLPAQLIFMYLGTSKGDCFKLRTFSMLFDLPSLFSLLSSKH